MVGLENGPNWLMTKELFLWGCLFLCLGSSLFDSCLLPHNNKAYRGKKKTNKKKLNQPKKT